jgi:hypothetical protein
MLCDCAHYWNQKRMSEPYDWRLRCLRTYWLSCDHSINKYAIIIRESMTYINRNVVLQTFMRRNSVYIGFIIAGAFAGERVCVFVWLWTSIDSACWSRKNFLLLYGVVDLIGRAWCVQLLNGAADSLWESNNKGVRATMHDILIRVCFWFCNMCVAHAETVQAHGKGPSLGRIVSQRC